MLLRVGRVQPGGIVAAGKRAGGGNLGGEADILLVAERHDLHSEGQMPPRFAQGRDEGETAGDAEIAVPATGIDHRVDMGADEERRSVGPLLPAALHGAGGIDPGRHAKLSHADEQMIGGGAVGGRQIKPRQGIGGIAEARQFLDQRAGIRTGRPPIHVHAVPSGTIRRACHTSRSCPGGLPQDARTPSFFCRLDEDVVYWKVSFLSGCT